MGHSNVHINLPGISSIIAVFATAADDTVDVGEGILFCFYFFFVNLNELIRLKCNFALLILCFSKKNIYI